MATPEPSYLKALKEGTLEKRAKQALAARPK